MFFDGAGTNVCLGIWLGYAPRWIVYQLKAVWDRSPPFKFDLALHDGMQDWKATHAAAPQAMAGDFETGPPVFFEVKAGQTTTLTVLCSRPETIHPTKPSKP
jgi:hypothetical protein